MRKIVEESDYNKGSIEIEYYSLEDLERVLEIFSGSVDQKVSMGKKFVL